jgi:glycosyltransferase involved in cell wall biosynthesis
MEISGSNIQSKSLSQFNVTYRKSKIEIMQNKLCVAIHWDRFGPYHIARLIAAYEYLQTLNIQLVGIETVKLDKIYGWDQINIRTPFKRYVIIPDHIDGRINPISLFVKTWNLSSRIAPDIMVVDGYSTVDSLSLLFWAKRHRRPVVIMSESTFDDKQRGIVKEWIKRRIVALCSSALCGGTLHKEYMQFLGMSPERIALGYDAIDNTYFETQTNLVRNNPRQAQQLPGLDDSTPFFLASSRFIKRKNLDGLLNAYYEYRRLHSEKLGSEVPWRLIILGDGEERSTLEQIIRDKKEPGVVLAGFRQIGELPSYYGLASAFIHSAFTEPWGLVVNEAMASGVPVLVSSSTGCAPDLVIEGQTGFIFDAEHPIELAELMLRFSSGKVDLTAMGQAAQAHIAGWGTNRFAVGLGKCLQVIAALRDGLDDQLT